MSTAESSEPDTELPERVPPRPGMVPGKHGGWLSPYPKGVSGNPGGVPGRKPHSEAHQRFADMKLATMRRMVPADLTVAEAVARRVNMSAVRGNVRAAIEAADRTEGKVPLSLTGADGAPLVPAPISLEISLTNIVAAIESRGEK